MSQPSTAKASQDNLARAEQLTAAIATLQQEMEQLQTKGEVAPPNCWVVPYQARGYKGTYWYYKLQATSAIFNYVNQKGKKSRYKHLGKAGSPAHVAAVMAVTRRMMIETLQQTIDAFTINLAELSSEHSEDQKKDNPPRYL